MLIAQGVHPKVLQDRLGHASITTTLDTYGHLMVGLDEAAADALGTFLVSRQTHRNQRDQGFRLVGATGIEPVTLPSRHTRQTPTPET